MAERWHLQMNMLAVRVGLSSGSVFPVWCSLLCVERMPFC